MNLASVVRGHAEQHGNKTAILCRGESLTYSELWNEIERLASGLHARGVRHGDRVGLSMSEHPTHLIAHFAVARLGAVIVPMDHRWTDAEKKAAVDSFDTVFVMSDDENLADAVITELPPIDEQDCDLLISLSSGTTGRPKGALLSHSNLYERFVSQWNAIGYGADDCFAVLTPFYFGAGRSFGMSLLAAGGSVLIAPPPLKPPEIVEVLQNNEVTATFLPPTLLRRLFDLHEPGNAPLFRDIRYLIASGEPVFPEEAHQIIDTICPNLYCYYASSEGGGISVLRPEEIRSHANTVGKPTYGTEVEIVDEDENAVGDGVVGRLRYRGPGVSTRMVDSDGNITDTGVGGWFYPGDLAERLDSGHIALRGRDKDVIIRGGVNIYPAEIEATLQQHDDISEAAVIGIDDPDRGEVVVAFVACETGIESLGNWCRERLAPYKVPNEFHRLDELPKRSSGKVDKAKLQENLK